MSSLDPSQLPAMVPPDGVIPNFVDPETRAPTVRIVICVSLALMVSFIALRIYSRLTVRVNFGADDYFCFASAASVIAYTGIILDLLGDPLGPHQWNVPLTKITLKFVSFSVAMSCMYAANAILVKSTLLIFYLRIFRPNKRARMMIWFGIAFIVAFYVSCIIANMVDCIPVNQLLPGLEPAEWIEASERDHCSKPELTLTLVQGVISMLTDFYVLAIPVSSVLDLHLAPRRKFGVMAIFLTGLLACACSVASVYYRYVFWATSDFTWASLPVYALACCEMNVGIICSCLPVVFATVKGFTTGGLWTTIVRYVKTGGNRSGASGSDGVGEPKVPSTGTSGDEHHLPKIPRGTMTGVRTFIRKAHRSKSGDTINVTTELHTFSESGSIDDSYHSQLQRGYFEGSHTNLTQPSQASFAATGQKGTGRRF